MESARTPVLSARSTIVAEAHHVVLLEHRVAAEDDFAQAARDLFALLKTAQLRHPGDLRRLVLSIEGHAGEQAGYDADFFEFQQEFMLGAMGRFFTWIEMPLTGSLTNSMPQEDAPADALRVT